MTAKDAQATEPQLQQIADAFWAHSRADDLLEHVYVSTGGNGLGIAMYLSHADGRAARTAAVTVCNRVLEHCPALSPWTLD
ncbi:hypothetical protein [Nonomuraea sp. NPDC049141]|uniref:hypothetical protein n=1 Tax=Nonomuraea sp. NPDC049141 TaxID=3155500 RepID=UPI0033ED8AF3